MPNCIILATQRTGSTLLCTELSALGGLGRPGEHFLDVLRQGRNGRKLAQEDFVAVLAEGRDETGAVGLKLMADYLPDLAELAGESPEIVAANPESASARMLRQIEDFIGPTRFFRIDRASRFDQALSRYLAVSTGIYFRSSDGADVTRAAHGHGRTHSDVLEQFDIRRLERHLSDLEREIAFLDRVIVRLRRPVLTVRYEDIVAQRVPTLRRCCLHAHMRPPPEFPESWMQKVVDRGMREQFRQRAYEVWSRRAAEGHQIPDLAREVLARGAQGGVCPHAQMVRSL